MRGCQVWLAPAALAVEEINHHDWFPSGDTPDYLLYNRLTRDTNLRLWERLVRRIRRGHYPLRASNFGFDLTRYYRAQQLQAGPGGAGVPDDGPQAAGGGGHFGGSDDSERCQWRASEHNWRCHLSVPAST